MDIVALIRSMTVADIWLVIFLASAFVFGFFQGGARGLMIVAAWALAFVLAANVREPLGLFLSRYWTTFRLEYCQMLAFLIVFSLTLVLAGIGLAVWTKRAPLLGRWPIADELLGGFLGLAIALLLVAGTIIGLDTFYARNPVLGTVDVGWITGLHTALVDSVVGEWVRTTIVPSVLTAFGPLIPGGIRQAVLG